MKKFKRIISFGLAAVMAFSALSFNASAVGTFEEWLQGWESIDNGSGYITLTPGEDETKMNFSWQSPKLEESIVIGK